jgi:hypothetical protein
LSKKVIIMSSQNESLREGESHDSARSEVNRGSDGDLQLQIGYLLADIRESLGEVRNAAKVSDDARKINDEKILQLFERTIRAETTLSGLKETVDRRSTDLDGLGARHNEDLNELKNNVNELGRKLENDINQVARRLENKINELGTGIGKNISDLKINDIGKLNNVAHTTASFGKFALALLAGGGLSELLRILITHHWSV